MPPPSSGGVALIEMLNMLEPLDLEVEGAADRAGAARADRGDAPRLSRSRAVPRRSRFRRDAGRAADVEGSCAAGRPRRSTRRQGLEQRRARQGHPDRAVTAPEPDDTTHYSVIDRDGMAVATTTRSRAASARTSSSRERDSCSTTRWATSTRSRATPTRPATSARPPNLIAPGQAHAELDDADDRRRRNGKLVLITGSPGGRTIINTVLTVVLGVTEYGLTGRGGGRLAADSPSMDAGPRLDRGERRQPRKRSTRCARWGTRSTRPPGRATRTRSGSARMARRTAPTTSGRRIRKRRSPGLPAPNVGRQPTPTALSRLRPARL